MRLVVFDWDETLTLSTFLPGDRALRTNIGWNQWAEYITLHNFETPFVKTRGRSRVQKLQALFEDLRNLEGQQGEGGARELAILTRNNQGAVACLNLLMMANLSEHFGAIWCMAKVAEVPNGVYRGVDGQWYTFNAPMASCFDHKADVLQEVARDPAAWFPQFAASGGPTALRSLRTEEIVLVDDVRNNFQSPSPARPRIVRYCKVARYDCHYRDMGFKSDMGGLGAKTDNDYGMLLDFVKQPWEYKAVLKARCMEKTFEESEEMPPVKLVVFDFDETLTLHTWMPEDARYASQIGFRGNEAERRHYIEYNFASPYIDGDRVKELDKVLRELSAGDPDTETAGCVLAVLTSGQEGAIIVLNLLMMAGLDSHFSAIWTVGGSPSGVFRTQSGEWRTFSPPLGATESQSQLLRKPDILRSVVAEPQAFFPQLVEPPSGGHSALLAGLLDLAMYNIVLVDDEPANFQATNGEEDSIVRFCEVTRYEDDNFRDQGLITHMGGLGAKRTEDYSELRSFILKPWLYREAQVPPLFGQGGSSGEDEQVKLERRHTQDELDMDKFHSPRQDLRHMGMFSTP